MGARWGGANDAIAAARVPGSCRERPQSTRRNPRGAILQRLASQTASPPGSRQGALTSACAMPSFARDLFSPLFPTLLAELFSPHLLSAGGISAVYLLSAGLAQATRSSGPACAPSPASREAAVVERSLPHSLLGGGAGLLREERPAWSTRQRLMGAQAGESLGRHKHQPWLPGRDEAAQGPVLEAPLGRPSW